MSCGISFEKSRSCQIFCPAHLQFENRLCIKVKLQHYLVIINKARLRIFTVLILRYIFRYICLLNLVSSYNKKKLAFLDKVDAVSITILVDNYTDILLASSDNVQRPPIINKNEKGLLIHRAEQGFASLVEIKYDNSSKTSLRQA